MSTSTTTTTTTMRSSERVLLEAFPAPPTHLPRHTGPPPTGPPSIPLPPIPGPSRVSVDEQLLFLSSVANRRSSKLSVSSSYRDSVVSTGSITPLSRQTSLSLAPPLSTTPRSPNFAARLVSPPRQDQLTRLLYSPFLSDIEDDIAEGLLPSPFLNSSWRRSKHHPNESISSIDVRAILADDPDGTDELVILPRTRLSPLQPRSAPPNSTTFSQSHILPIPVPEIPRMLPDNKIQPPSPRTPSSSSYSPSFPPISPSATSISDLGSADDQNVSMSVKDLRLERRAGRTKSPGLKRDLTVRSRSRSRSRVQKNSHPEPVPPKLKDEMLLDELEPLSDSLLRSSSIAFPTQSRIHPPPPRTPSPDIETILSTTPRPALRKAASQSRIRPQGIVRRRIDSGGGRRASEGIVRDVRSSSSSSWHGHHASESRRNRTLSRSSHGKSTEGECGSDDEGPKNTRDGDDSDSSIDLHTPLPHLMVRHGLLSVNSRLLPTSFARDGRASVMTCASTVTKSGIMKDERDTPMRRVRHRDNRLLRGGIGLTTGLGWSDSEDEDAPSPFTRRLSSINLSRTSSISSFRTTSSVIPARQHPLSRSISSGALVNSEDHAVAATAASPPPIRPRLPSAGRLPRPALPPTSWHNKVTPTVPVPSFNRNSGTRMSTSSLGSASSVETTLSDGVARRRPTKINRPGSGFRDSSGSSENYEHTFLPRKGSVGNTNRTSSSTASTISTSMPSTPRDYDPTMSSPAGFGIKSPYTEKSLPPLPVLRKRPSNIRAADTLSNNNRSQVQNKTNLPRTRATSITSSSHTSPPTSRAPSPVRQFHLPRRPITTTTRVNTTGGDRAAVPVPSISSISRSTSIPPPLSPPESKIRFAADTPTRPRSRTGTGMVYRSSPGSRIRAPMTLSSSVSVLERKNGLAKVAVGRVKST